MSTSSKQFCYVTLLMKGDRYLPGTLALAQSIRSTWINGIHNNIDIVCMVTNDVSTNAKTNLSKLYDHVVLVDYITKKSKPLITKKQKSMYESWMNSSYTKWRCLDLPYNKVLFMDSDKIVVENIDSLFELSTPAGIFSSPWSESYERGSRMKDPYKGLKHKDIIPKTMLDQALSTYVMYGTSILLTPTGVDGYLEFLDGFSIYGHTKCYSMVDETSIFEYFQKDEWTQISQSYGFIPWKTNWLPQGETPKVFHYFNTTKPWEFNRTEWPDLKPWWDVADKIIELFPEMKSIFTLSKVL